MTVITRGSKTYYYLHDGLGSVRSLLSAQCSLLNSYDYYAFGEILSQKEKVSNRYKFTSREWDNESSAYYYRARYYNPYIGRFTAGDPIGYEGGLNLYTYVGNNPINNTDAMGERPKESISRNPKQPEDPGKDGKIEPIITRPRRVAKDIFVYYGYLAGGGIGVDQNGIAFVNDIFTVVEGEEYQYSILKQVMLVIRAEELDNMAFTPNVSIGGQRVELSPSGPGLIAKDTIMFANSNIGIKFNAKQDFIIIIYPNTVYVAEEGATRMFASPLSVGLGSGKEGEITLNLKM